MYRSNCQNLDIFHAVYKQIIYEYTIYETKDYERDNDYPGLFLLSSTGQSENFMGHLSV